MKQYGIIGFPLSHSFSPQYFNHKFEVENLDCRFNSFPIENIEQFNSVLKNTESLVGLCVTIPYKTSVIRFLDAISPAAKKIKAVNCIKIVDGKIYGFNTDFIGFKNSLQPLLNSEIKKALILGTGGAAKAVAFALEMLGISFSFVSRNERGNLNYTQLDEEIIKSHPLIINTTPLGMYPKVDSCPEIPYQFLNKKHLLFDLVYNPAETLFLKKGKAQNALTKNGLDMLHIQAEEAWQIWNTAIEQLEVITLK